MAFLVTSKVPNVFDFLWLGFPIQGSDANSNRSKSEARGEGGKSGAGGGDQEA